jgi:ABC-type polysaccharide/polyol phosphate transport system ATPase subunit
LLSVSELPPPAIRVSNVSLSYRTTFERVPTLTTAIRRLGRRQRAVRVVEALRRVSFDVPAGTVLGIIGANGAGKSTLLRTLAGILPPDDGRIEIRGRVSTLLALGVGFNKNLSGRENVVLGGLAAGMSLDQVRAHYDAITEFAGLGDFMDLPMRTYSSGMYGRLAFAVATFMDPDILLVDEALSTGDASFRKRCFDKMQELCDQARTILLVSHGLSTVQDLATDCLWLHKGEIRGRGAPEEVIDQYSAFMNVEKSAVTMEEV